MPFNTNKQKLNKTITKKERIKTKTQKKKRKKNP